MKRSILFVIILFTLCNCGGKHSVKTDSVPPITEKKFILPDIPVMLTTPQQRVEYLAMHFWDCFNFTDTTLISVANITEQGFADFVHVLPNVSPVVARKAIIAMLEKAEADSAMYKHFTEMCEKYLYDPNSPFRNEEYYITVLESIIANKSLDELQKVRPQYRLEMALRNRLGSIAADFEYITSSGKSAKMWSIATDYLVIFFNNPDCHDCARVKDVLQNSPILSEMMQRESKKKIRILAVYPDEDLEIWKKTIYPTTWINSYCVSSKINELYDLKAIPTLYLLDKEKRVLLKDVPVEALEKWLNENINKTTI